MSKQIYKVFMSTPLGKKSGILTVDRSGSALSGWLDILEHKQPFEGTIDAAGNCRIKGTFITLLRTVTYIATGEMTESNVQLKVQGERNIFELSGVPYKEKEEQQ